MTCFTSLKHLSSLLVFTSTPMWTLASSKEYSFSFKCRCTAGSYAAQVALLWCTKCLWSGCLVSPTSEHSSLHMLCCSTSVWCFILGINQFLASSVAFFSTSQEDNLRGSFLAKRNNNHLLYFWEWDEICVSLPLEGLVGFLILVQ